MTFMIFGREKHIIIKFGRKMNLFKYKAAFKNRIVDFLRYCIYSYIICTRMDEIRMFLNVEMSFKKC